MKNPKLNLMRLATIGVLLQCSQSDATILFSDNFQSGLSQWVGGGAIVSDPTYGQVLSFSRATAGGDIFSQFIAPAGSYLSFDYKGISGFIGQTTQLSQDGASGWLGRMAILLAAVPLKRS